MERQRRNETLPGLKALIDEARERLSQNPDYIALRALEKARDEIIDSQRVKMVDDQTGQELALVPTGRTFQKRNPSQMDAARAALEQAAEPLTTPVLVDRVRALGGTVGGNNPNINLGSTLSRSEEFRSVKWKSQPAWWFKDRPLPGKELPLRQAAE